MRVPPTPNVREPDVFSVCAPLADGESVTLSVPPPLPLIVRLPGVVTVIAVLACPPMENCARPLVRPGSRTGLPVPMDRAPFTLLIETVPLPLAGGRIAPNARSLLLVRVSDFRIVAIAFRESEDADGTVGDFATPTPHEADALVLVEALSPRIGRVIPTRKVRLLVEEKPVRGKVIEPSGFVVTAPTVPVPEATVKFFTF